MLRKTAVVGIPLLAITMIYTLVDGGQSCFGSIKLARATSAMAMLPVLRFYVFSAILFAFYGYSFPVHTQGKRRIPQPACETQRSVLRRYTGNRDLDGRNHPAQRSGNAVHPASQRLSVCPGIYPAVAAVLLRCFDDRVRGGHHCCALSGTVVTALASTGLVLFLPRFVQFLFARGIVERVPIVGWLISARCWTPARTSQRVS